MACTNNYSLYLNFNCYSKLKPYFNRNQITDNGKACLEKGIQVLKDKGKYDNSYYDFFYYLAVAFAQYHPFTKIGNIPSCMLINYILYSKFDNSYQKVDKNVFEVYKEFIDVFFDKYNSISNSCSPYMKYLEGDELYKMKTLYTLYDEYEKFTPEKKTNTNILCSDLNVLRLQYNNFLNEYDGKENIDELMDKLINLKKLIEKNTFLINGKCQNEINYFQSPNKYLQKKKQEQEKAEQAAQAKQRAEEQQRAAEKRQAQSQSHEEPLLIIPPNGEPTQQLIDISGKDQLLETRRRPLEGFPSRIRGDSEGQIFTGQTRFTSESLREHKDGLEYPEVENTGLENTNLDPPLTSGVFGTLKNTFTDVLGQVDPVPVVGVSGGMGALFLLFRYTPVGAFFRGGRGRVHRIPRSFNGPFPGGFPGFEEYESGYIGYGPMNPLAE